MKQTVAKSLDSTSYFLIPLLDPTLSSSDFMVSSPLFLGTYTQNINVPWRDNHIFLLYKSNNDPAFNASLTKIKNSPLFVTSASIRLNGVWCILLTFERSIEYSLEITRLTKGRLTEISYDTKVKILSYWQLPASSNLHRRLFTFMIPILKIEDTLPEEDLTLNKFELELFEATA